MCRGEETNRITNNIETPPTTPDNFKSTLTTSAANKMDVKSHVAVEDAEFFTDSNIKQEAATRYSSGSSNVSLFSLNI